MGDIEWWDRKKRGDLFFVQVANGEESDVEDEVVQLTGQLLSNLAKGELLEDDIFALMQYLKKYRREPLLMMGELHESPAGTMVNGDSVVLAYPPTEYVEVETDGGQFAHVPDETVEQTERAVWSLVEHIDAYPDTPTILKCGQCGRWFDDETGGRRTYCSTECKNRYHYLKRRKAEQAAALKESRNHELAESLIKQLDRALARHQELAEMAQAVPAQERAMHSSGAEAYRQTALQVAKELNVLAKQSKTLKDRLRREIESISETLKQEQSYSELQDLVEYLARSRPASTENGKE